MRPWPRSGHWSCRCEWVWRPGRPSCETGDYFGAVLNRAAPVMAAGHGGQVLLAESTAGLLSGVDLLDLGPRRLRDLPILVGVFQVRAPGLRAEFPPGPIGAWPSSTSGPSVTAARSGSILQAAIPRQAVQPAYPSTSAPLRWRATTDRVPSAPARQAAPRWHTFVAHPDGTVEEEG